MVFAFRKFTDLERKKRTTQINITDNKCHNKCKYDIQCLHRGRDD